MVASKFSAKPLTWAAFLVWTCYGLTIFSWFQGKRRHPEDPIATYYSFLPWIKLADNAWLGAACPVPESSVWPTEQVWLEDMISEENDRHDHDWTDVDRVDDCAMQVLED